MRDFVESVAADLDVSETLAASVSGSLLVLLKEEGDREAVGELLQDLPGSNELMADAGTGGVGLLAGLGAAIGPGASAIATLATSGMDRDQIARIGSMFLAYAKERTEPSIIERVLASLPEHWKTPD